MYRRDAVWIDKKVYELCIRARSRGGRRDRDVQEIVMSERRLRIASYCGGIIKCSFPGPGAKVLMVRVSLSGEEMASRARWMELFVAFFTLSMTSGSRYCKLRQMLSLYV